MEQDLLTIKDVAKLLKIPSATIYKLVRTGKIPVYKIGKHYRFTKDGVDKWLEGKVFTIKQDTNE